VELVQQLELPRAMEVAAAVVIIIMVETMEEQ
jgi:hypothetical protein